MTLARLAADLHAACIGRACDADSELLSHVRGEPTVRADRPRGRHRRKFRTLCALRCSAPIPSTTDTVVAPTPTAAGGRVKAVTR